MSQIISFICGACIGAALLIFTCATPAPPPFEHHFAPAANLEAIDAALIGAAETRLDMAAYVLTDVAVINALAEAAARGVKLRIWRDPSQMHDTGPVGAAIDTLRAMGADMRIKPADGELMHLKAYCVDNFVLRTGAANFSASGLKRQDNDAIILRGKSACAAFNTAFERIFGQ